ncbi:Ku protein [Streptomyces sp. NPDC056653]|uniref:Ku protein n=1 Tax=Streptomyces sp. NPDC056653 TaxID=3345894 RepID=UPI0036C0F5C9
MVARRHWKSPRFVDLEKVEPVFFDKTYYLVPKGKEYAKVYSLLYEAPSRSQKAGIATFVMRNREYLVVVNTEGDVLALHTLHWADEVRDPHRQVELERAELGEKEVQTAVQLAEEEASQRGRPPTHIKEAAEKRRTRTTKKTEEKPPKPSELKELSKTELYQRASDANIPGRSSMSRDELIKALSGRGGRRKAKVT